jgi:NAD(P)-dependent dehydrogenase (short-subunit alcohol dehydrogenase family)
VRRDLEGTVAVVTGASRGLGQAVAIALAAEGCEIAIASRDLIGLQNTAELIAQRTTHDALFVVTDVTSIDEVTRLRDQACARFGSPTILINAAGTFGPLAPFSQTDPGDWIDTIMTNTIGAYLTCRIFAPAMLASGWGRIVNVSSAASLSTPTPFDSAYATSKAALNRLTRHLASEIAGTGVTANVLHPGELKTEMWEDIRAKVDSLGGQAEGFREWVEMVDRTGGDPMSISVGAILQLVGSGTDSPNGAFIWPIGMLSKPVESW